MVIEMICMQINIIISTKEKSIFEKKNMETTKARAHVSRFTFVRKDPYNFFSTDWIC